MAKEKKISEYNNQSITKLKGADRVRKRPAVIFGSDGLEGCEHSVFEILSNSVDEAREGFGKEIIVTAYNDRSVQVEDNGRGVPLGYNEKEKTYNWELIYCELYAGGKYNNNDNDSAYAFSLGLNGLGACATQYSSEYMDVSSYDGENLSQISFKKGAVSGELRVRPLEKKEKRTGTVVKWRPDLEVFTDINIPREYYEDMLYRQAVVNSGIKFVFRWQNADGEFECKEYCYPNGISDYILEIAQETAVTEPVLWKLETSGRDRDDMPDYKLKAEISFCISPTISAMEYYHNSSYLEHGGSPDKAVRAAFVAEIDKYIRSIGKYAKNESKITFQDIEGCLIIIINSFSTQTSYENQTKKAITNTFITKALTDFMRHQLEVYFAENPHAAEIVVTNVLTNKRSREAAETTRYKTKIKLNASMDISNKVEKFVGCRSKDPDLRELYIVEGDSACTSCKLGRDAEFQAIMPVRGKTLNCLKSSYEKIFKNDIICDLLRVIGCGVELKGKHKSDIPEFDFNAFRWSKIIFCTDADEDGFQIRTLLLTLFYRLLPTLIERGCIYIAESPLFEISTKDNIYFAYNEFEKADILKKLEGKKYMLQRSKGLGENEPDMMWQTTMNPETRRLIAVTPAEAQATAEMFDTLLGDNLAARKQFITENGSKYLAQADI